eukprot:CAMPEP_0116833864 /NCGR_PEP_ID=MMETSP0418-20121206/6676_1 /TAXON_ID=1158023 /ORGANISM="Astrosyne radiata, Strain 13vi08-1A" /LENGTH=291 /DNA_ID=CAMNT_0004463367 /DNA_START=72 /DNA_END=948 /DNA_ORIENTATION=+
MPFLMGSMAMVLVILLITTIEEVQLDTNQSISSHSPFVRDFKPDIYGFDVMVGGSSEDAKHASKYSEIMDIIEKGPNQVNSVQKRHIYKYLAMASMGGGWVAHSDVFPLHPFGGSRLPNNGSLTLYDSIHPCLMSGSAEEFLRFGRRMAEHATTYNGAGEWNEQLALQYLQNEILVQPQVFEVRNSAQTSDGTVSWVWNSDDCSVTHGKRAVHFRLDAHEEFERVSEPGDMVVKWLGMWLQACERSNYFEIEYSQDKKGVGGGGGGKRKTVNEPSKEIPPHRQKWILYGWD